MSPWSLDEYLHLINRQYFPICALFYQFNDGAFYFLVFHTVHIRITSKKWPTFSKALIYLLKRKAQFRCLIYFPLFNIIFRNPRSLIYLHMRIGKAFRKKTTVISFLKNYSKMTIYRSPKSKEILSFFMCEQDICLVLLNIVIYSRCPHPLLLLNIMTNVIFFFLLLQKEDRC